MIFSGPNASVGVPKVNPASVSAVVAKPAAPLVPDALATMTFDVTVNGVVVDVSGITEGAVDTAVVAVLSPVVGNVMSGIDGPPALLSSLMLRRMMNPTTTATTAMTMLIVEPMGAPPPGFAGGRRPVWSLLMCGFLRGHHRLSVARRCGLGDVDHADGSGGEPPEGRR